MKYQKLRIVHLSDIHFGLEKLGEKLAYANIRAGLVRDVEREVLSGGAAHAIFVAGDIAQVGHQAQYAEAAEWLEKLRLAARVPTNDQICIVPGNHDVNRGKANEFTRRHTESIRNNRHEGQELLAALADEFTVNHPFLRLQSEYLKFAEQYKCTFHSNQSPLWHKTFEFTSNIKLKIYGFNTAQLCNEKDTDGNILLGSGQFDYLNPEENTVLAVMMHHPPEWLMDRREALQALRRRIRVLITGHEHKHAVDTLANPKSGTLLCIASGAVTPPRGEAQFRYNWLEFACSMNSKAHISLSVKVVSKLWSDAAGEFELDRSECPGNRKYISSTIDCGLGCMGKATSKRETHGKRNKHPSTAIEPQRGKVLATPKRSGTNNPSLNGPPGDAPAEKDTSAMTTLGTPSKTQSLPQNQPVANSDARLVDLKKVFWELGSEQRARAFAQLGLIKGDNAVLSYSDERFWLAQVRAKSDLHRLWELIHLGQEAPNPFRDWE